MLMRANVTNSALRQTGAVDSFLLRAIVDAAADAIIVIDEQGIVQLANAATERLFGYPAEELIGANISVLMPEPHHSGHDQYLRNYIETGERKIIGIGREVYGRCRDGSTIPLYLSVSEVQHGERRFFAGIVHDLSTQKTVERALGESEQRLRNFTVAASDWTWEANERFHLTRLSDRFYEQTGISPEQVIGRSYWEMSIDAPDSELWRRHRENLEHHQPFREFLYRPQFGITAEQEMYFKLSGKPVFDAEGRFLGYRGTGTDVTERVLAKHALQESRRSLDTLMGNVPGMVYRCRNDYDWSMEFISEGGKRLTGYRPDEMLGEAGVKFGDLIHPGDRDTVWQDVQAAVTRRSPFELTYRIHTADGEEKWVWEHGCGVYANDGSLSALEGLIIDISERKQTESALRALAGTTVIGGGRDFVADCARELARTYGAKYASVGIFGDAGHTSIRTLAVWAGNAFAQNFTYNLAGTPCHDILTRRAKIVPNQAARRYPRDKLLGELGVESYFGTPLVDSTGNTVGLVSVMDTRPMRPNIWTRPILGVFANRVALELERQWADERLRESEAYMRLTLENAPIGIASLNLDGRLLDVNPAFAALLGWSAGELVGMHVRDITHPDDREETQRHFAALVRGDISTYELEKRYVRKDGDIIHVRARAGLVCDTAGRPMRVVGEVEDETERRRAALEIQRMRAYLKNIIESMPSVLVGVDTEGRITEWNRGAERSTGVAWSDAIGRPFPELFPQLQGQMCNIHEAIRRRKPIRTERLPLKAEDETHYAEVMVYPLTANGVMGAVIRMDDITERIRIEQMMVQSEKMLSVGGLAAGMAHEISNPLSIVMQSAQNVLRRLSKDLPANRAAAEALGMDLDTLGRYLEARGVVGFIEGIQEAAARASQIVEDMLAFSRHSAYQLTPNRLDEMLETAVRLAASDYDLKKKYDFRQIEVVREYDPGLKEVNCDRTQLEQVILNLIKNSAHAMADAGTPLPRRITLRTGRDDDFAYIEVEDNGPGMDEATRLRVFEPFFTTKDVGTGTGLGLSVSDFIITQQHKGTINVVSRKGKGSCFTIRLPLNAAEAA